jgi:NitT/TauT family transport system substrate-binding protein
MSLGAATPTWLRPEEVSMSDRRTQHWNRREFVGGLTLVSTAGVLAARIGQTAAERPPETTKLRLSRVPGICVAPQYVAEEFLRAEGFSDVHYVEEIPGLPAAKATGSGQIDIAMNFAAPLVVALDAGDAITLLAGIHVGCFELFATEQVRSITGLKGKTVGVVAQRSAQHIFLATILTQFGMDPGRDVNWVYHPAPEAKRLLAEGKIDAFLGFEPDQQELRAKKIGHSLLNSTTASPWRQYFCCMLLANREFVRKHPLATKRAVRAVLKGDQVCALEPDRGVRAFQDRGFVVNPEYARQAMRDIPFGRWRDYNPEDTVRFYALRLHEAGMVKSTPQKILAQGTDWRFLNELKKELKG